MFPYLKNTIALLLLLGYVLPLSSQVHQSPKPTALVEEQDYAFATGLFKDRIYKLAEEQFTRFLEKYPTSMRRMDAMFMKGECLFHQAEFDRAAKYFEAFLDEFPRGRLTADAHFRRGESFVKLRRAKEAIEEFKIVLDKFPNSDFAGEAAYWIGETYLHSEDFENALKYYGFAYEGFPNNRFRDYAAYSTGWVYQKKGNHGLALEWYERVLREFPQSVLVSSAKIRIGEALYYTKEYRRAVKSLEAERATIAVESERAETDFLIAESYYQLNELEKAQRLYETFLSEYPNHRLRRDATYGLGWTLLKKKQYAAAIETFGSISDGNDHIAHAALYRKGVAEQIAGQPQTALATFRDVQTKNPTGDYSDNALYDAGMILFEQGKGSEAKNLFQQVISEHASSDVIAESHRMLGECYIAESNFDLARHAFEQALTAPSASFDVRVSAGFQLGWAHYKLQNYRQASASLGDFIATYPRHPLAHDASFWLAEAEYQLGNFAAARTSYEKIADLPRHEKKEDALYGAAWSWYKLNEFGKAITAFDRLLSGYPNGKFVFDARLRTADCYFFLKEYRKAVNAYRTVIRSFPKHASIDYAHYQLAQTHFRAGEQDQAVEQFTNLIKLFPDSELADDAQYAIGWVWFQNKEYKEAVKEFQKVILAYPSSDVAARAHYSIGDAYYNLQQFGQAERAYREVLKKHPTSPFVADAISGIQYCLAAQGKTQDALKVIDDFVAQNPDIATSQSLYLRKGDLLLSQKDYEGALRDYRSFLSKYARSVHVADAHYSIGKVLQIQGKLSEAATSFQQAASTEKAPPKIVSQALFEAGSVYLQQKNYERAMKVLERIENEFNQSEIRPDASYLKGLIFLENGDKEEAKNQFTFVASRYPTTLAAARANLSLIRIMKESREYDRAQKLAQEAATTRTDELGAEAQYLSGTIYGEQEDWTNAITAFLRVRYVFASHQEWLVKAYLALGNAYEQTNDYRRAKEAYENVVRLVKEGNEANEAQKRLKQLERS